MIRPVIITPTAEADLLHIAMWIAEHAGAEIALGYVDRVRTRTDRLQDFPYRGVAKPEFGDGVRSLSFERSLLILYRVEDAAVRVLRVVSAERDLRGLAL